MLIDLEVIYRHPDFAIINLRRRGYLVKVKPLFPNHNEVRYLFQVFQSISTIEWPLLSNPHDPSSVRRKAWGKIKVEIERGES